MDYDKIVQQRRRNWEALKPEEIRKKELEEERERKRLEREAKGKEGFYERRRRLKEEAASADTQLYRRNIRQAIWLAAAFIVAILVVLGVERFHAYRQQKQWGERIQTYNLTLNQGQIVDNLKDPIGALATWRGAWMRGDMAKVVSTFSKGYVEKAGRRGRADLAREYQTLYQRRALEGEQDIAEFFSHPELLRMPSRPWTDKELALFRTPLIQRIGDKPPGTRFIAAFSYDSETGEWRFADAREAQYFNVKWTAEQQISTLRYGPRAPRFDEKGNRVDTVTAE